MTLDEAIIHAKELAENQSICKDCREDFKQLAAWLEELKQYREERIQETNLDHFQQEILEKGLWNLAVVKGRPERCDHTKCLDCELSKDRSRGCHEKVMNWLKQPRKAPAIKLTKFEIDLLQSCSQGYSPKYQFKNINSLTEMRKKKAVKAMLRDFVQQVVNLSESLEGAEMEEMED